MPKSTKTSTPKKSAPKLARTHVKRSAPIDEFLAGTYNPPPVNKATASYIESELDFIKTGFEILTEYTFEGGPQEHKEWLVEVLNNLVKEVHEHASALDMATNNAGDVA
jgi:hypothetical protein